MYLTKVNSYFKLFFTYLGFIFWSDWGSNPHVGRSDLSGKNSKIIFEKSESFINAIVLEPKTGQIWMIDAQHDQIMSCR
jgi:low-density lipoprotein receptor-related protein 1 (alpha-2-macroglobulin receptor)